MKKLATFVFALLLAGSLSFAQAAPAGGDKKADTTDTKKAHKGKKSHKGGKKSKKGAESTTTAAPK